MAQTLIHSDGIAAGAITRAKLNTTTAASAVIAKVIAGTGVSIAYTGVDSGTGDVTVTATGGGAAANQGSATINFGTGNNEASIAVTGQSAILTTSEARAVIMGDDTTSDHTASDHEYIGDWLALTCGTPTAGTGFTIYGRSSERLTGTFKVRWVWAN